MGKRIFSGIVIAVVLFACTAAIIFFCGRQENNRPLYGLRTTFPVMGTIASFTLYVHDEAAFVNAVNSGKEAFERTVKLANLHDAGSELSRLNATAYQEPFVCSNELWKLLMRAERAWLESDGLFDISIKPLMDLWGFYRKRKQIPSAAEVSATLSKCGFSKLVLDREKQTVKFSVPGMALDLGGIAKGYAVDRACDAVMQSGISCGVIDLGGNLKLLPSTPPGKNFYTVGVRDPAKRGAVLKDTLELPGDCAVATSGDYERFVTFAGRRYGHIINPATGSPEANAAATVVAESALDADIYSTSAYLGKEKFAAKLKSLHPEIKIYFVPATDN